MRRFSRGARRFVTSVSARISSYQLVSAGQYCLPIRLVRSDIRLIPYQYADTYQKIADTRFKHSYSKPKSCRNRSVVYSNDFLQSLALSFIAETSYNPLWRGPELDGCLVAAFGTLFITRRALGDEQRRDS